MLVVPEVAVPHLPPAPPPPVPPGCPGLFCWFPPPPPPPENAVIEKGVPHALIVLGAPAPPAPAEVNFLEED